MVPAHIPITGLIRTWLLCDLPQGDSKHFDGVVYNGGCKERRVKLKAIAILVVLLFVPVSWTQQSAKKKPDEKVLRAVEDTLAKQFVEVREKAKLKPLYRIRHRVELAQFACTAAVQDKPSPTRIYNLTIYRTDAPDSDQELEKIALSDAKHPTDTTIQRFSIAVWRSKDTDSRPGAYWVSIGLLESGAAEFFDTHFTDDAFYKNDWKESVSLECRDIK